jgi:hypothetical protein
MANEFAMGRPPPIIRLKRSHLADDSESIYTEPRAQRLLTSFVNTNPIYAKLKIHNYLNRTVPFDPCNTTKPGQIRVFLHKQPNPQDVLAIATQRLRRFSGTFQEWQVFLKDLQLDKDMFKSNFVFKSKPNRITEFNTQIADAAQYIFQYNHYHTNSNLQRFRLPFRV